MKPSLLVAIASFACLQATLAWSDCPQDLAFAETRLQLREHEPPSKTPLRIEADRAEAKAMLAVARRHQAAGDAQSCEAAVRTALAVLAGAASPAMVTADALIGRSVRNGEGEELGTLRQIVIDGASGRIAYGLIGTGGLWGIGERVVVVPWAALQQASGGDGLVLNVSLDKLRTAPRHDARFAPRLADREWSVAVHKFFDVQPYWRLQDPPLVLEDKLPPAGPAASADDGALAEAPARSIGAAGPRFDPVTIQLNEQRPAAVGKE